MNTKRAKINIAGGKTCCYDEGLPPKEEFSATEIAEGCRRMAGICNQKISMMDYLSKW